MTGEFGPDLEILPRNKRKPLIREVPITPGEQGDLNLCDPYVVLTAEERRALREDLQSLSLARKIDAGRIGEIVLR
jgi:hypothetical protein